MPHAPPAKNFLHFPVCLARAKTRIVWEINDPRNQPNGNADRKGGASFNLNNASDVVIDNLTIDNPAKLGSNFRDAAWYFIDCQFPDTLKPEGKIFIAQSNPRKPQPVSAMFKWATDRVYFAGAKGPVLASRASAQLRCLPDNRKL